MIWGARRVRASRSSAVQTAGTGAFIGGLAVRPSSADEGRSRGLAEGWLTGDMRRIPRAPLRQRGPGGHREAGKTLAKPADAPCVQEVRQQLPLLALAVKPARRASGEHSQIQVGCKPTPMRHGEPGHVVAWLVRPEPRPMRHTDTGRLLIFPLPGRRSGHSSHGYRRHGGPVQ